MFGQVAKEIHGAGSASAVRDAYYRVVENLEEDQDYYRTVCPVSPHLLKAAASLPRLSD